MVELVELRADGSEGEALVLLPCSSREIQHLAPRRAASRSPEPPATASTADTAVSFGKPTAVAATRQPLLLQYAPKVVLTEMELPAGVWRAAAHCPLPANPLLTQGGAGASETSTATTSGCPTGSERLELAVGAKRRRWDGDIAAAASRPTTPLGRTFAPRHHHTPPRKQQQDAKARWARWGEDAGGELGREQRTPAPLPPLALPKRTISACYDAVSMLEMIQQNLSGLEIERQPRAKRARPMAHPFGCVSRGFPTRVSAVG